MLVQMFTQLLVQMQMLMQMMKMLMQEEPVLWDRYSQGGGQNASENQNYSEEPEVPLALM